MRSGLRSLAATLGAALFPGNAEGHRGWIGEISHIEHRTLRPFDSMTLRLRSGLEQLAQGPGLRLGSRILNVEGKIKNAPPGTWALYEAKRSFFAPLSADFLIPAENALALFGVS